MEPVNGESQPQDDQAPIDGAPERPEWLPEKFWTPEGPNVENLAKSYGELETMRGNMKAKVREEWEAERLAARPETPDQYALPEGDVFDAEALAASPVVGWWREFAHAQGLGNEEFQAGINAYAQAELARLDASFQAEMAALGENGKQRAESVGLWAAKTFGEGPKLDAIRQVCTTAAGVEAIEDLMRAQGADPTAFEGASSQPQDSEDDIKKLMESPAYWDGKRRDPAVVKRVEAFFAKKYG